MKKAVLLIKILLPIIFLYNLGLFQGIKWMINRESKEETWKYDYTFPSGHDMTKEGILRRFIQEKCEHAKQLGNSYGAKEYFDDYEAILAKEVELQQHALGFQTMEFANVRDQAWRQNPPPREEIDKYRNRVARKYPKIRDPNAPEKDTSNMWYDFLAWLLRSYLLNIPLALVLFLIWQWESKGRLKLTSPLRLVTCTLAYPLFIVRKWLATAEMRRTKRFVTDLLDYDEVTQIKQFAFSTMKLKAFRQNLTTTRTVRHSYLMAVIGMILVIFLSPLRSLGNQTHINKKQKIQQEILTQYDSIGDNHTSDDSGIDKFWTLPSKIPPILIPIEKTVLTLHYSWFIICKGFHELMDPIPWKRMLS